MKRLLRFMKHIRHNKREKRESFNARIQMEKNAQENVDARLRAIETRFDIESRKRARGA